MLKQAIHFNRDENSFTARLFEHLFHKFSNEEKIFDDFILNISKKTLSNKHLINEKKLNAIEPELKLKYIDGMLFVENFDLYCFCKKHNLKTELNNENIDKTEFDCIIVAENESSESIAIVFEVKCFTDLKEDEVIRQNKLLESYKNANLFKEFYHLALISHENITRGKMIRKTNFPTLNNFSIISWEDIKDYIPDSRFNKHIEFSSLSKKVTKHGSQVTKRTLIKHG